MPLALSRSCLLAVAASALVAQAPLTYPATRKADVVDNYFGTKVADPYRWLEDDHSADTAAWVAAQNQVTQAYLGQIPERQAIEARMTRLWNYERYGAPSKHGKYYVYSYNSGLQNQAVIYLTERAGGERPGALRPQCPQQGRHRRAGGHALQRGRRLRGLQPVQGRFRRGYLEGPRRGYGRGPAGHLPGRPHGRQQLGEGWQRLLLHRLPQGRGRQGAHRRLQEPEAVLPQAGRSRREGRGGLRAPGSSRLGLWRRRDR